MFRIRVSHFKANISGSFKSNYIRGFGFYKLCLKAKTNVQKNVTDVQVPHFLFEKGAEFLFIESNLKGKLTIEMID